MHKRSNNVKESVLDSPRESLDPAVWQMHEGSKPTLAPEAQSKIDKAVSWVVSRYGQQFGDSLSVYMIGSICSNSWSKDSDIDIDFCATDATEDDNDEEIVKEFGWKFKKDFIDNYMKQNPEDAKIGTHPLEVYFNPNPFQCFMSVGCYNILERKWEVGPDMKPQDFDPVSKYYSSAMKQVDRILKDIRDLIFDLYENSLAGMKSSNKKFKNEQFDIVKEKLNSANGLLTKMKVVRSNFQKPAKSKEEALKRRNNQNQHVVDAAFKFLEKFGYIPILKDFIDIQNDLDDGGIDDPDMLFNMIALSVKDNISRQQHINDSEALEFVNKIEEADMLNESLSNALKMSAIAGMMSIFSLLPSNSLAKELEYAKKASAQAKQEFNVNSNAVKTAIKNASKDKSMVGPMTKTNVVNAIAQVLWKEARGEGDVGLKAIASVIWNRAGKNPKWFIDVIKQKKQFSCMNSYKGGWTDSTYRWYNPNIQELQNPGSKNVWELCKAIALQMVDQKFTSTIGNRNVYANENKADKKNVESWIKDCDLKIGNHKFGYRKEYNPNIVQPGTFTTWKEINRANKKASGPKVIIVKAGDTLGKIAKANGTTVDEILKLNKSIKNPSKISIGQQIKLT